MPIAQLSVALVNEVRMRMFDESQARIVRCLGMLSDEQIWWRPNASCNSVGNLVLHLCGNIGQWVVAGLGPAKDTRDRDSEFAARGPIPRDALLQQFDDTMTRAQQTIDALQSDDLLTPRRIQGFDTTALSALIHVTEHLSFHTGQITWITKMLTEQDTGYYAEHDLNAGD